MPAPAAASSLAGPGVSQPSYRAAGVALIRASAFRPDVGPSWWPAAGDPAPVWTDWLMQAWSVPGLAEAIGPASPDLARRVQKIRDGAAAETGTGAGIDAGQVVRAAFATARYLTRARGRATPYGRFAGVAAMEVGGPARVDWTQAHRAVGHGDPVALAELVAEVEADPRTRGSLRVQATTLWERRSGRLAVTWQPHATTMRPADVSIRDSEAVQAALAAAARPVSVNELIAELARRFPATSPSVIEGMVAGLIRCGALISELRAPSTVTDPDEHVRTVLARTGATMPARQKADSAGPADLALGSRVAVPDAVLAEAARAGELLAQVAGETAGRAGWRSWHRAFLNRYGAGAQVAVRDVVDPVTGLGWPAHLTTPHGVAELSGDGEVGPVGRDRWLAELAQDAALAGAREVALEPTALSALSALSGPSPGASWPGWAPHMSVCAELHASSAAALDGGDFRLWVSGVGRTGAALLGRHLRVLSDLDRDRMSAVLRDLPVSVDGATPAQLGVPPYRTDLEPVARVPQVLPRRLPLAEHTSSGLRLDDLSVLGDHDGLYLLDGDGELTEPVAADALVRHAVPRWARFLTELPGARHAPVRAFDWGGASTLPFRPRLRVGRVVLSAARWRLDPAWLPGGDIDDRRWCAALAEVRARRAIPERVAAGTQDRRLRLDLTRPMDTALLRAHLARVGGPVTLVECPAPGDQGWIGDRAHELVVPLATRLPPRAAPVCLARRVPIRPATEYGTLPGTAGVVSAYLDCGPASVPALITDELPALLDLLPEVRVWWLPMRSPRPHLRLRIHTTRPGMVIERVAAWAGGLRSRAMSGDLSFETYRPEIARYGHGPDPAAAMDAAEALFVADSATAAAQLTHNTSSSSGGGTDALIAMTAASLLTFTAALTGTPEDSGGPSSGADGASAALAWLVRRADLAGTHPVTDRTLIPRARALWTEPPPQVGAAWRDRAAAAAVYRRALHPVPAAATGPGPGVHAAGHDGPDADRAGGRDARCPQDTTIVSLLHLHCVRVHRPDPAAEQLAHRIARTIALGVLNPRSPR